MDLTELEPVTAKDVLKLFHGIPTKPQLMKLCEHGAVKPYRDATGTGSNRLFDWYNLIEMAIWRELYVFSLNQSNMARVFKMLRDQGLNEKYIFDETEFIAIAIGMRGGTDPSHPLASGTKQFWVKRFSSGELTYFLKGREWFLAPHEMNFSPLPKGMVIIDFRNIKASLEAFFAGRETES